MMNALRLLNFYGHKLKQNRKKRRKADFKCYKYTHKRLLKQRKKKGKEKERESQRQKEKERGLRSEGYIKRERERFGQKRKKEVVTYRDGKREIEREKGIYKFTGY